MGCFWGAERKFWETPGVTVTAVGYAGGPTPNPTYKEVCSGRTGHAEAVLVVYDPKVISYEKLLRIFWENHDPTQGMRQGNDSGTQYRSAIYTFNDAQKKAAEASREAYQKSLTAAGYGKITTEIREAPEFYLRRGLPPAVPGQESGRLLRHRRDGRELPGRPDGRRVTADDRAASPDRARRAPRRHPEGVAGGVGPGRGEGDPRSAGRDRRLCRPAVGTPSPARTLPRRLQLSLAGRDRRDGVPDEPGTDRGRGAQAGRAVGGTRARVSTGHREPAPDGEAPPPRADAPPIWSTFAASSRSRRSRRAGRTTTGSGSGPSWSRPTPTRSRSWSSSPGAR